jgi:hypothetical protein
MFARTNAFAGIQAGVTPQVDFYLKHNATPNIMKLVRLENKSFGTHLEKIAIELFKMRTSKTSRYDAIDTDGKRVEIKCARYWGKKYDAKWQHIMFEYEWDVLLVGLVDFNDVIWWELDRATVQEFAKPQGHQGYWLSLSDLEKNGVLFRTDGHIQG